MFVLSHRRVPNVGKARQECRARENSEIPERVASRGPLSYIFSALLTVLSYSEWPTLKREIPESYVNNANAFLEEN